MTATALLFSDSSAADGRSTSRTAKRGLAAGLVMQRLAKPAFALPACLFVFLVLHGIQQPGQSRYGSGGGNSIRAVFTLARYAKDTTTAAAGRTPVSLQHPLMWMAPLYGASGFSTEAINYLLSLRRSGLVRQEDVWAVSWAGANVESFIKGLPQDDLQEIRAAEAAAESETTRNRSAIVVCHMVPAMYARPRPDWGPDDKLKCPPDQKAWPWSYVIGRAMFEADRVSPEFALRCNAMDEVWVPTEWQREVFIASGIDARKLRVLPQGINTSYFDPSHHKPLDLAPRGKLVFGSPWKEKCNSSATEAGAAGCPAARPVRFITNFKWEKRKGWDFLLDAYLTEFAADEAVELYILTRPFEEGGDFPQKMMAWAATNLEVTNTSAVQRRGMLAMTENGDKGAAASSSRMLSESTTKAAINPKRLPTVYVIDTHISDVDLPGFYAAGDAFVLPTRGEGWGRPLVEAMSMAVPVIASNWSGPTAFLSPEVGYPLEIEGMEQAAGWPAGLRWARPSVRHLRTLLRAVVNDPQAAAAKGAAARALMVERFSPAPIARALLAEVLRVERRLSAMDRAK